MCSTPWRTLPIALLFFGICQSFPAAERWNLQYFYDKNDSTLAFIDLQFLSAERGIALGSILEGRKSKPKPVVALTSDGGRKWELVSLKEPGTSLFFLNGTTGWMVGLKGRLLKTTDGGRTWTGGEPRGVHTQPVRVFFLDESRGWLLCNEKKVYATQDGGRSWQLLEISSKPDLPQDETVYSGAAFFRGEIGMITGWSRPADYVSEFARSVDPGVIPSWSNPAASVLLFTADGGKKWRYAVMRGVGEIVRARIASPQSAVMVLRHLDARSLASEIVLYDLTTFRGRGVYGQRSRFLTDIAVAAPDRAFAAAIEHEAPTATPPLPAKVKVLQSADMQRWTEMEVDYRAEARRAVLSALDPAHAWLATDTGMILKLVTD